MKNKLQRTITIPSEYVLFGKGVISYGTIKTQKECVDSIINGEGEMIKVGDSLTELFNLANKYGKFSFITERTYYIFLFELNHGKVSGEFKVENKWRSNYLSDNDWSVLRDAGILEEEYKVITDDWVEVSNENASDRKYSRMMFSPRLNRLRHQSFTEFYGGGIVD